MCTAVSYCPSDHYFGRNLDLERSYGEGVIITPRHYPFKFRNGSVLNEHYAIIGIATTANDYPLYFEAVNEHGLCLAGLNFPNNAHYFPHIAQKDNISPFELIPWLLGTCKNMEEAESKLASINLWNEPFSKQYPLSPLHWLLCDRTKALTIESTEEGLRIYNNPIGVLTNNPPFPYHLHNLANYMALTNEPPRNNQPIPLTPYSLGMGSFGLPGDMSSGSRFIKAAFTKLHSVCEPEENSAVNQFFHILGSVYQQRGLTQLENGEYEYTLYSSCCNADKGIYYYRTYDSSQIISVNMNYEDLDSNKLIAYPLVKGCSIQSQN